MYYFLTEAVKRRFILELRRYWAAHPKYRNMVDNIQHKYSFEQRPCEAIVLKTSSANQVQLSADNFQGTVHSFAHLARMAEPSRRTPASLSSPPRPASTTSTSPPQGSSMWTAFWTWWMSR